MARIILFLSLSIMFANANNDQINADIEALNMKYLKIKEVMYDQHAIRAKPSEKLPNKFLHSEYCLLDDVKINDQNDWTILFENTYSDEDFFCYISKDHSIDENVDVGF